MTDPSASPLDRAAAPRPGEELPLAALEPYIHAELPEYAGPLAVKQYPGGHSNLTYLLALGARELVLRRPPFGPEIKTAHDMSREYRILSAIHPHYPRVPRPLHFCGDPAVIGAPFYLMQPVHGIILRADPPASLDLSPPVMARLSGTFIDNLAAIHGIDCTAAGLGDLGHPQGYIQRQVSGWTKRYYNAQTDEIASIDETAAWLAAHMPPDSPPALIHNDYKYDNLILDPAALSNILAVLDWEMATIGDPYMDLGTALAYWVEAGDPPELQELAFGPTARPGSFTRLQLAERYGEVSGRPLPDLLFYYVFALFKLAVIVQQIYHRYHTGHSRDERFAGMIGVVKVMGVTAQRALQLGRIDRLGDSA